uniref:Uncharacterized protein n=1 Tax=Anopheles atroparvus TaxID=41427 RepID=A0AAG5D5M1_ANOAO
PLFTTAHAVSSFSVRNSHAVGPYILSPPLSLRRNRFRHKRFARCQPTRLLSVSFRVRSRLSRPSGASSGEGTNFGCSVTEFTLWTTPHARQGEVLPPRGCALALLLRSSSILRFRSFPTATYSSVSRRWKNTVCQDTKYSVVKGDECRGCVCGWLRAV